MDTPSSTASLPRALTVAYKGLQACLNEAIAQFEGNAQFSNARGIRTEATRFIRQLCREPSWQVELERRAWLVERGCGPGSAYRRTMSAAWKAYRDRPGKKLGPKYSGTKVDFQNLRKCARHVPQGSAKLAEIARALERVVASNFLGQRAKAAFKSWLDQCRVIQGEAEDVEADGCMWLYGIYESTLPDATERSNCIWTSFRGGTVGGVMLEPMLDAANSLVRWMAEHWARISDSKGQSTTTSRSVGGNKAVAGASWKHLPNELKPDKFREGPLRGTNKHLCLAMGEKPNDNQRWLQQKAEAGCVWVVWQKPGGRKLEVWFDNLLEYRRLANGLQKLREQPRP